MFDVQTVQYRDPVYYNVSFLVVISGFCPRLQHLCICVMLQSYCQGVPEDDVLQVKWVLYYTRSRNTDPQHILLGGNVSLCSHTVYIAKVTGDIHHNSVGWRY